MLIEDEIEDFQDKLIFPNPPLSKKNKYTPVSQACLIFVGYVILRMSSIMKFLEEKLSSRNVYILIRPSKKKIYEKIFESDKRGSSKCKNYNKAVKEVLIERK